MPKLRESILEKIHAKKIIPRPRWQYVLLHAALWLSGVVTILLGSFAFAFLLLEVSLPSRVYFSWIEATEGGVMIEILPYLW
ncbi:hypothetical protein H6768_04260 [Candidatus Peribacteria bacterium]|nr:hypothetical protein [Candidatus Peribacteria bacterium]